MTAGGDGSEEPKKAKRGAKPNPAYAVAAEIAWQNFSNGMTMLAASRSAVEALGSFGDMDLRGLVEGATGPLPNQGLFPDRGKVKAGLCTHRILSEFTDRQQRPGKWTEPNNGDAFPRYYLASGDIVVQQVYAMVRRRKKAEDQK